MRNPTRIYLLLLLVVIAAVLWFKPDTQTSTRSSMNARNLYPEVSRLVRDHYVDSIAPEKVFSGAYNGIMRALDEFSAYIPPQHRITDLNLRSGKGYWAGIWIHPVNRHFEVARIDPDSPAGKAGLNPGDHIESVNGVNLTRQTFYLARLHLFSPTPREFNLTVVSRDQRRSRHISVPAVRLCPAREPRLVGKRSVYMPLAWIDAEATRILSKALLRYQTKSWIVDLRGYQSGDLSSCMAVADLLLPPTNPMELRTRLGVRRLRPGTKKNTPLQIIALVGPATIMYGEMLAALMQAADVTLVGNASGGHIAHLKRTALPDGGTALITDGHFFWKGEPMQKRPVIPQRQVKPNQDPLKVALRTLEKS